MLHARSAAKAAVLTLLATMAGICSTASLAFAQPQGRQPVHFHVSGPAERLEMIVNTSRILTLDFNAPRMLVNNPSIITASPLSTNQIQVSARTPGITEINIWDEDNVVHAIDVIVYGDARELQNMLKDLFPDADIEVRPSNGNTRGSVILTGYVPRPDAVNRIVTIAQDFYPNVINNMTVGGVQTVLLHVKVLEVSRTKLRRMGMDWAALFSGDYIVQGVNGLVGAAAVASGQLSGAGAVQFAIFDGANQFGGFLDLLRQNNLAKLLAEPTLVTISGRPASFNSGGQIPVPVSAGLGVTTVQFREFGTNVDFVPIVLGNGKIRIEVRGQITEIAPDLRDAVTGTPGFRSRRVDTGVEMKAGQTLALAGLIQRRTEAENTGLPVLSDLPWAGALFRRVREQVNEVELLIMVSPEFVDAMDAHEVPCGPGEFTTSPSDVELYGRGYIEVPKCCTDGSCSQCQGGRSIHSGGAPIVSPGYSAPETLPQTQGTQPAGGDMSYRRHAYPGRVMNTAYSSARTNSTATNSTATNSPPTHNRYAPQNQQRTTQPAPRPAAEPGLIGPIGYDVLK
jgi:pilus assembly protein CpaC